MSQLTDLLNNNRAWARAVNARDPEFFARLCRQQAPEYLWIGCSDSRVPANEIVGLLPGELFVHRNVANVVIHTDLNCLSVIQYAVDALKVKHIIACGHYGCGGVLAAMRGERHGLTDNWLLHVRDIHDRHAAALAEIPDEHARYDCLCELNVIEQVANICRSTVIQDAWARKQPVVVHAWIYALRDGLIRDLGVSVTNREELSAAYERAVRETTASWLSRSAEP